MRGAIVYRIGTLSRIMSVEAVCAATPATTPGESTGRLREGGERYARTSDIKTASIFSASLDLSCTHSPRLTKIFPWL